MKANLEAGPGLQAGRREWAGLAVLALPTLLTSLDISVLYLAVPHLSESLHADSTQQLWILDIYSFMLAGFLVTMGTLGDRIGRRRLLLIGASVFSVASVLAAYSVSPQMLIASRALLGIAGATLMPSTMALIRNIFKDPKQMGTAIGIWFACFMGGMTVGPLVGGALLEHFWWGSAFLLGVPVMVLLLIVGPRLLPEYRDPNAGRLDLASVALSLAAILPAIYGLKELARNGVQPLPVAALVIGIAIGVVFVSRQRRLASPLLDLRLFANRNFSAAMGVMLMAGIVMAGTTLLSSLYLQTVQGLGPLNSGMWLLPQNIAMVVGSMAAPALARKIRPAYVIAAGLVIAGAGLVVHSQVPAAGGLPWLVTGLVLAAFGIAFPMSLTMNLIMGSVPPEKAGSAASISQTSGEFGVAMGVAALGSLATFVYRTQLGDHLPAGLPAGAAQTASQSITAALSAAQQLPGRLAGGLTEVARTAFTSGLNVVAAVGAAIFIGLAILSVTILRRTDQPAPAPDAAPDAAPAAERDVEPDLATVD
ncbi:MFS transporter [Sphaerisporangium melleum]|uniref:MFS transporter n=1 Tax=Sphaerisporangium melleum TaxID=321316 RepID=A0A917R5E9_9ACTN|nr:MFS transporter [Sphaerisporangium melleum]GGK91269.1 MFS transporter [Sphaerisporangium melleum]GII72755.1 MFS transporter [Sphaerisporangium melleum]